MRLPRLRYLLVAVLATGCALAPTASATSWMPVLRVKRYPHLHPTVSPSAGDRGPPSVAPPTLTGFTTVPATLPATGGNPGLVGLTGLGLLCLGAGLRTRSARNPVGPTSHRAADRGRR